jgi:hypothetical protein
VRFEQWRLSNCWLVWQHSKPSYLWRSSWSPVSVLESQKSIGWNIGRCGKSELSFDDSVFAQKSSPGTRRGGAWGERRYSSYSFSTSALDGGEWSASRPGRSFTPEERNTGTHYTNHFVLPRFPYFILWSHSSLSDRSAFPTFPLYEVVHVHVSVSQDTAQSGAGFSWPKQTCRAIGNARLLYP